MSIVFITSLKWNSFSTNVVNTIQYTSFKINVFPLFLVFITLSYTAARMETEPAVPVTASPENSL